MEDDLNIFLNGRRPKKKLKIEVDLNLLENGRRPHLIKIMLPETLKIKTMVVAPLRVT
jgi:hypothetical protein